jgi:type IV secretory pathway TraG/TraD family ATPase VirD4
MRPVPGRWSGRAVRDARLAAAGLVALAMVLGFPATLLLAGPIASARLDGWVHFPDPSVWPTTLSALLASPGSPEVAFGAAGPSAAPYWSVVGLIAGTVVVLTRWLILQVLRSAVTPGFAGPNDLRMMSEQAMRRRSGQLRPGLDRPPADCREVALPLAAEVRTGSVVWASHEDTVLVVGPPRSAKTAGLVTGALLDVPGSAVVTSTRPDLLVNTGRVRRGAGPVWVFDPQSCAGWPEPLRWSPISGCDDPARAVLRGRSLAAASRVSAGTTDGDAWEQTTADVLRCYLHAAALDGATMRDILRWAATPTDSEPIEILRGSDCGTAFWAEALAGHALSDPRLVSSIWFGVGLALSCLADPQVLDLCCPSGGSGFRADDLLDSGGTIYLLGTPGAQLSVAPLVVALVEEITETGRRRAAASPGGRLDPPLHLLLDEVANIAPLPTLPQLMSDGGGSGIPAWPVVQSLAQLRHRWGQPAAESIWDAATYKLLLPGMSNSNDLEEISRLVGERDDIVGSYDRWSIFPSSTTIRRVRVLPPEQIRTIADLHCLILPRSRPPVYGRLTPWWERSDVPSSDARRPGVRPSSEPFPTWLAVGGPLVTTTVEAPDARFRAGLHRRAARLGTRATRHARVLARSALARARRRGPRR